MTWPCLAWESMKNQMMDENQSSEEFCRQLGISPRPGYEYQQALEEVRRLIAHDMHGLLAWLYRVDVNENKIETALHANPDKDSAEIILMLVLERMREKANYRLQHPPGNADEIPPGEEW